MQIFSRNPRGSKAKEIDEKDVAAFREFAEENGIGVILAHAPYTLNACAAKASLRTFARETLADDLARLEATPGNLYNFHPGSHVGQGAARGIELIAAALNAVLRAEQHTTVLLETMAGKGTEVGRSFEELAAILARVERREKMGVCLDTCHLNDAGYNILIQLASSMALIPYLLCAAFGLKLAIKAEVRNTTLIALTALGTGLFLAWLAGSRGWNKCHVWLGASLMGVTVECTQYFLPWRSFEPLDMLANCSGALLGILLVCAQQRWIPSFPAKCKKA